MVLPDGSAAPGALPTYSGGGSIPPPAPLRPNNMLAAIQSMPPQEKRAMLVSALKRALPIMMQTAQVSACCAALCFCFFCTVLHITVVAHRSQQVVESDSAMWDCMLLVAHGVTTAAATHLRSCPFVTAPLNFMLNCSLTTCSTTPTAM